MKAVFLLTIGALALPMAVARADVNLHRVMFLPHSATGEQDYHPLADMDHDGLLEMAYVTGRIDSNATNPWRWEYGRFLPFNRWQPLYADTLLWPPPNGLAPASFTPFAMGDADHDGLNEILGTCLAWYSDSAGNLRDSLFLCTMEQHSPAGIPDTLTWLRFIFPGGQVPTPRLPGSLDGDSLDDILTCTWTDSVRGHHMLENRGNNAYVRTWTWSGRIAEGPSFAFGDCDGDGRIEFMGGDNFGTVPFWEAAGDDQYARVFKDTVRLPDTVRVPNAGWDCFFGRDVNRNGKPEFFQTLSRYVVGGFRFYLFMWESDADN
ncbi:hypothetical protein FJY70_04905, partial [candidate division WOR-3 bacterium]|nr:hypothetical protein [candidate division WOR-3 bacterium]